MKKKWILLKIIIIQNHAQKINTFKFIQFTHKKIEFFSDNITEKMKIPVEILYIMGDKAIASGDPKDLVHIMLVWREFGDWNREEKWQIVAQMDDSQKQYACAQDVILAKRFSFEKPTVHIYYKTNIYTRIYDPAKYNIGDIVVICGPRYSDIKFDCFDGFEFHSIKDSFFHTKGIEIVLSPEFCRLTKYPLFLWEDINIEKHNVSEYLEVNITYNIDYTKFKESRDHYYGGPRFSATSLDGHKLLVEGSTDEFCIRKIHSIEEDGTVMIEAAAR